MVISNFWYLDVKFGLQSFKTLCYQACHMTFANSKGSFEYMKLYCWVLLTTYLITYSVSRASPGPGCLCTPPSRRRGVTPCTAPASAPGPSTSSPSRPAATTSPPSARSSPAKISIIYGEIFNPVCLFRTAGCGCCTTTRWRWLPAPGATSGGCCVSAGHLTAST